MRVNDHFEKFAKAPKLSICQLLLAIVTMVFLMPDVIARGGEAGAHAGSAGIDGGGHGSRNFSGHRHIGRGQKHSGGHRFLGGGYRHFGGIGHNPFGSRAGNFSGGHWYDGGGYYSGYLRGFSYTYLPGYYVPPDYYAPGAYSYSYPSYSRYRPQYESPIPNVGEYRQPQKYSKKGSAYRYNSASVRYPDIANGDSYSTNDLGWRLLAQNSPKEALDVFAVQAGQRPQDGVLKVGYALSAAMQRDLNKAAWAMRGAFRIDPDSLHYLKIDASLRSSIDTLLDEYHNQLNYAQGNRHFDVAFMIAALNYLIHEIDAARAAIEESVDKLGDNTPSAINLQRLVANNKSKS